MMGFHAFHPPFCVHLEGTNTLLVPIDDDRIYIYIHGIFTNIHTLSIFIYIYLISHII